MYLVVGFLDLDFIHAFWVGSVEAMYKDPPPTHQKPTLMNLWLIHSK